MNFKSKYLAIVALPVLISCSGHPASGTWQLSSPSSYQYNRLVVNFDGKAELYKPDQEIAWLHCFWTARAADMISLECASADQDAENEIFNFKVSGTNSGQLLIGDQAVAQFVSKESAGESQ